MSAESVEPHLQFRKCAQCGAGKMVPIGQFRQAEFGALSASGAIYRCPDCEARTNIRDGGSLLGGIFFAMIAGILGTWAFIQGPYWYTTHLSYFSASYYETSFIILDLLAFIFYSAIFLFGVWIIWRELIVPLKAVLSHPVTGENRPMDNEEAMTNSRHRKMLAVSFFLFPFIVYAPLFGSIWILDQFGIDVRDDETLKIGGMAIIFGGAMLLAKRYKVPFALVFFGMVFWMALTIGAIFLLG